MLCCSWADITVMKLINHTHHQKTQPLKLNHNISQSKFPNPRKQDETWATTIRHHEHQRTGNRMVSKEVIMDEHDLSHITHTSPAEPTHPRCWAHDVWSIMSSCQQRITLITQYVSHTFCSDHTDTCLFDTEGQINMGFASVPYTL